jgi:hypothetical protein
MCPNLKVNNLPAAVSVNNLKFQRKHCVNNLSYLLVCSIKLADAKLEFIALPI